MPVFKRVLPMLEKKPLIIQTNCAPEYHTTELMSLFIEYGVKEVRHSNEHCQAPNGMVEIFGDTPGWAFAGHFFRLSLSMWGALCGVQTAPLYVGCSSDLARLHIFQTCWLWYGEISWTGSRGTQETFIKSSFLHRHVYLDAGLSWDILLEFTVCAQA